MNYPAVEFTRASSDRIEDALLSAAFNSATHTALVAGQREVCFRELAERVAGFAQRLGNQDLAQGDRVALFQDKTIDAVVALYGTWLAGGIAVPVNESLRRPQALHILKTAGCRFLVTNRRQRNLLSSEDLSNTQSIEVGSDLATVPEIDSRQNFSGGETPAAILFTSGSTGLPKGILLSHDNLCAGTEIVSGYLGITSEDRILSALPFSFDYGLNQLLCAIHRRARCVLQRSALPADLCRSLVNHEISVFAGVPPLFIQLMSDMSPFKEMDFPALRILTNTGGVFPADLVARYRSQLPDVSIFLMYGFSEAFRSTFLPTEELDRRPDSMGRAIPRCEVFVVDETGRECEAGEIGELIHRGPTVALGYWNDPKATTEVFRTDPIDPTRSEPVAYSGDLVRRDEEGFLYYVGRRDEMFKSMGFRISPEDVEQQLRASGLVSEVVVGSRPDELAGNRVIAHVVPVDPASFESEQLFEECRRNMPPYMVPTEINVYNSLPRTASGKFDRRKLLS